MCTVSLTPHPGSPDGFILTSNRDEAASRMTLKPEVYLENGIRMLYPKDEQAGGTWIGISGKKRAVCILNGGFNRHVPDPPYRKSRGLVLKDFLAFEDILMETDHYDLEGIEPFTSIAVEWGGSLNFFELVWDGSEKHVKRLPHLSHIWSSSPLFSEEVRKEKEKMFADSIEDGISPERLLEFHSVEDPEKELIIDRGFLRTLSITQIIKDSSGIKMLYRDLLQKDKPVFEHCF